MAVRDRKSEDRPLTPDELVLRDNAPASEPIPPEVARRLLTRRLVVSGAGDLAALERRRPGVRGEPAVFEGNLPDDAILGLQGRTATRLPEAQARRPGAKAPDTAAHRPAWADQVYHPKRSIAPSWMREPVRRKGGRGELFYGVYPPDDRAVYYPSGYPWQCVGRVFAWTDPTSTSWSWWGSGVLVGPRHVLTAGHVPPWGSSPWMMLFVPAYYDGKSIAGGGANSYVSDYHGWDVSFKSRYPNAYDMSLLRLYDPLGDALGYFGSKTYSPGLGNIKYFNITGYPSLIAGGERPSYQPGIEVLDTDPNGDAMELEHHGDATGGDSGAPFWATYSDGFPYVLGTVSGGAYEYEAKENGYEDNNIVAGGKAMVDLIRWGLQNWP